MNEATALDRAPRPAWAILVDTVERLSGARSMADIIDIVRRAARQISGADGVTFVLRDGDKCHYVEEDAIGPLWKGQKFPLSACISGWAMLNKRMAVIPDIYVDPRIPHDAYRPTFVKSLVMVPVRTEDPLAAIGSYWARQYEPSPDETSLLESLARATATAIANVTLQASLRDAALSAAAQADEIRKLLDQAQREAAQRLKTEEQLRQSQKMEALGNLTGGLAHDFNNLLGVIIGNLDLLSEAAVENPAIVPLARDALDAALRGADLTRSLLAFARRQPLRPAQTDVNELIANLARLLRRVLGENVEVVLLPSQDLWSVVVDRSQLEAAIVNLATNARDAMPRGGRIVLSTRNGHLDEDYAARHVEVMPGDYAIIEVSDSGTGIEPDLLERIFEPFFTTKEQGKGTGLGLSMVFGFMRQSGGHINVYSELGKGTTFRLYLPRADVVTRTDGSRVVPAVPPGGRETVVVVEDNGSLRRLAVQQLEKLGYRVIEAETARSALEILDHESAALLFTDVVMPGGIDGFELARTVREKWPSIRIILTSGFPEVALSGAEDVVVLSKPYRRDDLARVVREVLDH